MAIPASGPLTFSDIQTEFGGTNPIALGEYYAGGAYVAAGTSGTYGAVPSSGQISVRNFYGTSAGPPTSSQSYTTSGSYSWVAPASVTSVSVVAIGGGARNGGGLGYKNNITVNPGCSYTVVVGVGFSVGGTAGASYFVNTCTVRGGGGGSFGSAPASYTGDGGGYGGRPIGGNGGGGAGGYAGDGGGASFPNGFAGSGGAGGGGGTAYGNGMTGGGGGGTGLFGQGSSGSGGAGSAAKGACCAGGPANGVGAGGGGGSGGNTGTAGIVYLCFPNTSGGGGLYGGGAGTGGAGASGAIGAVRIVWPGTTRTFPSTNVGP